MLHLLVATTNPGKIKEITELLKSTYVKISNLSDFPELQLINVEEIYETYEENALLKARTIGRLSGLITLADDSGLSVDALKGKPGVHSKRYGKEDADRIAKLLTELSQITQDNRQAHFICSMVIFDPSSEKYHTAVGRVDGFITTKPAGTNGFGYDPVFFCPEINKTFGEATEEEKNQVSHRSKALVGLAQIIRKHYT